MSPRVEVSRRSSRARDKAASAFQRGHNERPLCVFIDDASLASDDLAASIIRNFVGHRLLEIHTTSPCVDPHLDVEKPHGPYPADTARIRTVGAKNSGASLVRPASQWVELATQYAASEEQRESLTCSMLLAADAERHGADAFVTASAPLLAAVADGHLAMANVTAPKDAVALIGLYLRLRQDFAHFHSGASSASYGKGGFYGMLAEDLLPNARRWLATCPDNGPWGASPLKLAAAVLTRVERALYARDRIHEHLLLPKEMEVEDGVLFYLDAFLYSLSGAFDAIGRVVHAACGIDGAAHTVSWRNGRWLEKLDASAPAIAAVVRSQKPHRDALNIVFVLRNYIHAEGLSAISMLRDQYRIDDVDHPLLLPPEETTELREAFKRLGG